MAETPIRPQALPSTSAIPVITKIALVAAIGLFWGGNWPAVKTILSQLPPLTLRAIGFSTGAIVLLGWARLRGLRLWVPLGELPWLATIGLLIILLFNLCTAFAQLLMPTSRAAIMAFTMPIWATLIAIPVLGERPGPRQIAGLFLGMTGLGVLLGPEAVRGDGGPVLGPIAILIAAVSWALGSVLMKRRGQWSSHAVVVTGWQYAISAVPMIIMALVLESPPPPTDWAWPTWLALGFHLVFSICIAQILWFVIVRASDDGRGDDRDAGGAGGGCCRVGPAAG